MASRRSRSVGVRELRQNLSIYLEQVKRGRSFTVTEHGHPVAELRPLQASSDVIERLVRDGLAVPAKRSPTELPLPASVRLARPSREVLDELREDRV